MTGSDQNRRAFLAAAAATLTGLELGMSGSTKSFLSGKTDAPDSKLSALRGATGWLNSRPLTAADLRGKVVLVEFWTYTCINWLRALPYVRAWAGKYRDHGLTVIGVHTPEFRFEHNIDNVRTAAKDMRVDYPIALDNDYAIWKGFENQYWPAYYLLDRRGDIRHRQFGEGAYDQSERMIQRLLEKAGADIRSRDVVSVEPQGIEAGADWSSLASPEIYLGLARTEGFVSTRGAATGSARPYVIPDRLRRNQWALAGDWMLDKQAAALKQPNGRLVCRFQARDLHLVMGPATPGTPVRFRLKIDGQPPERAHGLDIDARGEGVVTQQRLYQLIRQPRPIVERQCEIEFLDPGIEVFAFTFG